MSKTSLTPISRQLLVDAAEHTVAYPFEIWRTGDAVALEGLLHASQLLGDTRWRGWVQGVLKGWTARAQPYRESDDTAAGRAMCMSFVEVGDDAILEGALGLADYLMARRQLNGACVFREAAPLRRPYGNATLTSVDEEALRDPGPCVLMNWLQMPLGFLAWLGTLVGSPQFVEFAATQTLAQLRFLQDSSGLLWHFWLQKTGRCYGLGWGRGQVWSLLGLMDVLEFLPVSSAHYEPISAATRALAEAIRITQLENGGWHAVLVDKSSPVENSTAALAVAAFKKGLDLGTLSHLFEEAMLRAWEHVRAAIRPDGVLSGVSGNIGASTIESHYSHAPLDVVVPWGQGPLLLAIAALAPASLA